MGHIIGRTLIAVSDALVAFRRAGHALDVLQTERRFVTVSHLVALVIQDVVVSKNLHTVIMPEMQCMQAITC